MLFICYKMYFYNKSILKTNGSINQCLIYNKTFFIILINNQLKKQLTIVRRAIFLFYVTQKAAEKF